MVKDLMIDHPKVMRLPEPTTLLTRLSPTAMEFEAKGHVADVFEAVYVASDLRKSIFKSLGKTTTGYRPDQPRDTAEKMTDEEQVKVLASVRQSLRDGAHPMADTLNIQVASLGIGTSEVHGHAEERFYNSMNRAHGGYAATLIDTALGWCVATRVPENTLFGTIELKVNYVGKIDAGSGTLVAQGQVIHVGRTLLTAEARVVDARGKLCAHGSGTFMVYPANT